MSATICIVALSSTHKTILLTAVESHAYPTRVNRTGSACYGGAAMAYYTPLHQAAADAVAALGDAAADDLKVDAPPKPALGDFAVGCFAIAKARGASPAKIAQDIAARFAP